MIVEEGHSLQLLPNGGWDERIVGVQVGELVRSHVLFARDRVVVYDTLLGPLSGGWLARFVAERRGSRPVVVVISHSDWDHCWGNQCFSEPLVGSHECARRMLGAPGSQELARKRQEHADYAAVEVVAPWLRFEGNFELEGGDLRMQFLATPGHRPDHLALYLPQLRTLLPGDAVETPFALLDEEDPVENFRDMLDTLEKLAGLPCDWLLCNHAPPQAGNRLILDNLAYYRKWLYLAREGDSLEALLERFPFPGGPEFYRDEHRRIGAAALKAAQILPAVPAEPPAAGAGEP